MADKHSTIQFPGIFPVEQGSFTFSEGITPSVATVTATFVGEPINEAYGTLKLVHGQRTIEFPGCRLDNPDFVAGDSGQSVTVRISDRRWRWEFGEISGEFNVRAENGVDILENTKQTSRELARRLLLAMDEKGFDLQDLPVFTPPESNWVSANPATELAAICELGGCRVVLGIDNRVRLFKTGQGKKLPRGPRESVTFGADLPSLGDSIKAYAQRTRWEVLLELEAVGIDTDYSIETLVDLSYNPAKKRAAAKSPPETPTQTEIDAGWEDQYPEALQGLFDNEDERQIGLKSLYRWYRVKKFAWQPDVDPLVTIFGELPGFGKVECLEQILPLLDVRVAKYFDRGAGVIKNKPAEVEGEFYDTTNDPPTFVTTAPKTQYRGSFSFDAVRGIVLFNDPTYRLAKNADDEQIFKPARLFLRIAVEVKSTPDRVYHRASFEQSTIRGKRQNTGPLIVDDKAARLNYILEFKNFATTVSFYRLETDHFENRDETQRELEKTIARRLDELETKESAQATYTGIERFELDGAIQQISWSIGPGGGATTISRNSEHNLNIGSFRLRRREEKRRKQDRDNNA